MASDQQLASMQQYVQQLRGEVDALSQVVSALQSRLGTNNTSSNVDSVSGYQIHSPQQVTLDIPQLLYFIFSFSIPNVSWTQGQFILNGVTYDIAAGSTSLPWIIWQASNPNVFQGAVDPLPVGPNDFVVGTSLGGFSPALDIHGPDGSRSLLTSTGIWLYNKNGWPAAKMILNAGISGGIATISGTSDLASAGQTTISVVSLLGAQAVPASFPHAFTMNVNGTTVTIPSLT